MCPMHLSVSWLFKVFSKYFFIFKFYLCFPNSNKKLEKLIAFSIYVNTYLTYENLYLKIEWSLIHQMHTFFLGYLIQRLDTWRKFFTIILLSPAAARKLYKLYNMWSTHVSIEIKHKNLMRTLVSTFIL